MIDFDHLLDIEKNELSIIDTLSKKKNEIPLIDLEKEQHNWNKLIHDHFKLLFAQEDKIFSSKQNLEQTNSNFKILREYLREFNKISDDNQADYREKKRLIKKAFSKLEDCPLYQTDYFSPYREIDKENIQECIKPLSLKLEEDDYNDKTYRKSKMVQNLQGEMSKLNEIKKINKEKKVKENKRDKNDNINEQNSKKKNESKGSKGSKGTKGTKETKRTKLMKKMLVEVSPFPFKTQEECKERTVSKPTFVSKEDMLKKLEKLGYKDKKGRSLNLLTKDELCQMYFS